MGELRCVDGSVLSVVAVTCRDRAGQPYEITLNLARDSMPFASVGERCGHQLAQLADQVSAARADPEQAASWPDPDDRFPSPALHPAAGPPAAAGHHQHRGYLPGEAEYFALRSRDRVDPPGSGELRCVLRSSALWLGDCAGTGRHGVAAQHPAGSQHVPAGQHLAPGPLAAGGNLLPAQPGQSGQRQFPAARDSAAGHGRWRLTRRAVIEAWGTGGIGVRAVLTSAELVAFLDTVLSEEGAVLAGAGLGGAAGQELKSAGNLSGGVATPLWRQRGKVPDGIARSRLPAVRAPARGGTFTSGDSPPRRGDVRR